MEPLFNTMPFTGYVYPNESGPHPLWGFLIVLYPYITGLVAGAFIMASLVRSYAPLLHTPKVTRRPYWCNSSS